MSETEPVHVTLPSERCFWAVVEAPGVGLVGPLPEALMGDLADALPVPSDEVFAVCAPAGADRLLICAARRTDIGAIPDDALSLVPAAVPEQLGVRVEPSALNLLVGECEPRRARRSRARRNMSAAAVVLVISALATVGIVRRARYEDRRAVAANLAAETIAREMTPGAASATAILAMDDELARLRRAAAAAEDSAYAPPADASGSLASLLNVWPCHIASKPQSVSVTANAIMVSVVIDGPDAAAFLDALHAPLGWALEEPRLNTSSGTTRLGLSMKPAQTAISIGGHP